MAVDKNARCGEWAARDPSECTENWRYMTDNCRKSCKQCGKYLLSSKYLLSVVSTCSVW